MLYFPLAWVLLSHFDTWILLSLLCRKMQNFVLFCSRGDRIQMMREELDNPHKEKTWRVWKENFSVEVVFQDAAKESSKL